MEEIDEMIEERELKAGTQILEMVFVSNLIRYTADLHEKPLQLMWLCFLVIICKLC